jgi:hypothetical protein
MTETYSDAIDIASVTRHWPTGRNMLPLIGELGTLIKPLPWGILGHWYMKGESFNEFWVNWCRDGANLDGQFGIFMGFANGTQYAVWYHGDDAAGAHPIVGFGDEGGVTILAANIKAFFSEWASGRGIGWLDPFDCEATPEILAERIGAGAKMLAVINAVPEPKMGLPIAELQARLDATVARAQKVADEKERQRRLITVYGDKIDLAAPQKYWPPSHVLPPVIAEFGALIKPWIDGSIGQCSMAGQRMSDGFIDCGADLHDQFGFFLVDHRYSPVAIWYHEGAIPGSEPIVDIRSTSFDTCADATVVAPNLKTYLSQWANAVESGDATYGLIGEPEIVAQRPVLLAQMRSIIDTIPDPQTAVPVPDFCAFLTSHRDTSRVRQNADPLLQEMARILKTHFPLKTDPLWNSIFIAGDGNGFDYSLRGLELNEETFPEGKLLTPLLKEARRVREQGPSAALGPWISAVISLYPDRRLALEAYWDT